MKWLSDLYEHYVIPGRAAGSTALHCDHWAKILFMELRAKQDKKILSNEDHSVLSIDGVYVDLELNAYIKDFNWGTVSIDSSVIYFPINSKFVVQRDQMFQYYSKPAKEFYGVGVVR